MDEYRAENVPGTTVQSDSGTMLWNELEQRVRGGASWFYWIAGFSVINTIILNSGGDVNFLIGLGFTYIIDQIFKAYSISVIYSLMTNSMIAGIFVIFGVFASRGKMWGFFLGLILYTFDALIFMLLGLWANVAFHVLAWIFVFLGLRAALQLRKM